jgi:signal transduction histidine kinase
MRARRWMTSPATEVDLSEHVFDEMKRYVAFGAADERVLSELGPLLSTDVGPIIDEFYARIEQHPDAVAVITRGAAQVERLKATLRKWVERLFVGPWDVSYFDHRAHIGRRHVLIQLPQHYNFTAMDLIRNRLIRLVLGLGSDAELTAQRVIALNKLIDLELAIILHTYNEDWSVQLQRNERLATFGQMTSAIGHELRNPLGVIESSVFLLRRRVGDDPGAARHLDKIQGQVARSNRIITSLLDIVGDRPPARAAIAPLVLAERAITALRDATGFDVELRAAAGLPEVMVDEGQIQQVLLNLLNNAFEAAGAAGVVRITLRLRGSELEFLVADDGPGVDPSVRLRIFEPLVTTKDTGVGLGLALCRKLVHAHAGALELVASPDLRGAAFSLRLPAAPPR